MKYKWFEDWNMSCTLKGDTYSFIQVVTKFKCIPPKHGFNGLTAFQLKFQCKLFIFNECGGIDQINGISVIQCFGAWAKRIFYGGCVSNHIEVIVSECNSNIFDHHFPVSRPLSGHISFDRTFAFCMCFGQWFGQWPIVNATIFCSLPKWNTLWDSCSVEFHCVRIHKCI